MIAPDVGPHAESFIESRHMKITFLVTHYRNQSEVLRFLTHLFGLSRSPDVDLKVAIADNSGDLNASCIDSGDAVVIRCPKNLGYINGCQFALDSSDVGKDADFVFVSNTDVELEPDFFDQLTTADMTDRTGVIAPRIIRSDRHEQNPHSESRPSRFRLLCFYCIYSSSLALRLLEITERFRARFRKKNVPVEQRLEPRHIYAAHGSLFGLTRRFFTEGGRPGFPAFLYGEEFHIAEQARQMKLDVVFCPQLIAHHSAKAVTSGQSLRQKRLWKRESLKFLLNAYFHRDAVSC